MKNFKRFLSALLVLMLCVSLFPVSAFAGEDSDLEADDASQELIEETAAEDVTEEEEDNLPVIDETPGGAETNSDPADPADDPTDEAVGEVTGEVTGDAEDADAPVTPAEDDPENADELQGAEDTEITAMNVPASMFLADAAGEKAYYWDDDVAQYYNYYLSPAPGSKVSLWVRVDGLSNAEMANVSYEWTQRFVGGNYNPLYNNTGTSESQFPAFTMGDEYISYQCRIHDGQHGYIYVAFDLGVGEAEPPRLPSVNRNLGAAAEVPVMLEAEWPEVSGEDSLEYHWSFRKLGGKADAWQMFALTAEPKLRVNPKESTEYLLEAFSGETGDMVSRACFSVNVDPGSLISALDQDYYALAPGETVTLNANPLPSYWCVEGSEWVVEDEQPSAANKEDNPTEGNVIDIIPNEEDGTCSVTAVGEGTAFVAWVLYGEDENGKRVDYGKLRCRVDVVKEDSVAEALVTENYVNGVYLPATTVTTNLYSTGYTRFEVLVDLENNQVDAQSMDSYEDLQNYIAQDEGIAIESARFTDEATADLFALRVVDDRTLEIVPTIDFWSVDQGSAKVKAAKSSYSSAVAVKIDGHEYVTQLQGKKGAADQKLTIKVQKKLPTIKSTSVKFNSFVERDNKWFTPNANWSKMRLKAKPGWIEVNGREENGSIWLETTDLYFTGTRNKSYNGKLNLLATVDGWAVEIPLTVTVKAAKSAPKLKVGSVTINPKTMSYGGTYVTVTPQDFADDIRVTKITEGKTVYSVAAGNLGSAPISATCDTDYLHIELADSFDKTKAHTFKVTLDLKGVTATATVKTLALSVKPTLKLKATGTINSTIVNSTATVTWTTNMQGLSPELSVHRYKGKNFDRVVTDAEGGLQITRPHGGVAVAYVTECETGTVLPGYTYYLVAEMYDPDDNTLLTTAKTKLNVTWPQSHPTVSTTLKVKGTIDLIRPNSTAAITIGALKNSAYSADPDWVKIYTDKAGKNEVSDYPFDLVSWDDNSGTMIIGLRDDFRSMLLPTSKYYVGVNYHYVENDDDGNVIYEQQVTTKPVQIKIVKGSAKGIGQTAKTVQLLKNDRFSYANIGVTVPAGLTGIKSVTLDAKSAARFSLVENGSGSCELHFKDNVVTTKAATVKLNVFLEGNNTGKADKVLSVKVNIA